MKQVRLIAPTFPPASEIAADYQTIAATGIFTNSGPFERRFADTLAAWIGRDVTASLTCNATAALELALQTLVQPARGRRVLVASFTFAAGPLAIKRTGFSPLFVDVDSDTWQPELDDARRALDEQPDVVGILLSSTFGVANPAIADWEDLARRHRLPLIVDSAAGFGSQYPWGERSGARGDCEIFSLHATKTMAIGEGGAVVSRDRATTAAIDRLKNFGFDSGRESVELGTNAKLDELSSAIGLRQLAQLPSRLRARQRNLEEYRSRLEPLGVVFQPGAERAAIAFVSALLPTAASQDALVSALEREGVECRTYYNPPVHRHSVFTEHRGERALSATEDIAARIISLPMADDLGVEAIDRVAEAAREAILAAR